MIQPTAVNLQKLVHSFLAQLLKSKPIIQIMTGVFHKAGQGAVLQSV